jgi:GTP-binding protein Era
MSLKKAGFVSVVGRPNVGKSTLMNALLGQKVAAVSPRPQTTRRNQLGILTTEQGQAVFIDTPGMHEKRNKLGELMNEEAVSALADGDILLFIVDASTAPEHEDRTLAERLVKRGRKRPVFLLLNKTDLIKEEVLLQRKAEYGALVSTEQIVPISAQTGAGLPELLDLLWARLPEGEAFYPDDQVTDMYEKNIAADLIREAALNLLRDEIPHGVAVRIDEFTERGETGAKIDATIFVERESHKGIVIGAGGAMIKQIGQAARAEIEKMSGRKVYLELRVKVKENWRDDEKLMQQMGYTKRKD